MLFGKTRTSRCLLPSVCHFKAFKQEVAAIRNVGFFFVVLLHTNRDTFRESSTLSENYLAQEFKNLSYEYGVDIVNSVEHLQYLFLTLLEMCFSK